jgi:uncharacterized membrane protein YdbT with pleckstrin-like domain
VAFDKKLLHEHEDLVLDLRPHWWFLWKPSAALLASALLGSYLLTLDDLDWAKYVAVAAIVGSLLWLAARYVKWVTTNFVVTTDRLIYRSGVLAKKGIEIPLERVNTVFFSQTIVERMMGAGDLSIESGGETGKQNFTDIRKPSAVQNEIYRQMEANNERMYHGRGTSTAGLSVAEQLEKLDDLRRRGVIDEGEFLAQKDALLRR